MEIVITAALSIDGHIADLEGITDWVQDWELFEQISKEYGCLAMGRKTYEEDDSDFEGVHRIVLTSKNMPPRKNVYYVTSVDQAVAKAKELGFDKLLVIGGARTNESFIKSGKVSKLFVDLHPLTLGRGKKLFGEFSEPLKLKLLSTKQFPEGFVHLQYEVTNLG